MRPTAIDLFSGCGQLYICYGSSVTCIGFEEARDANSVLKFSEHYAPKLIVAQTAATVACFENMFAYAVIQASFVGIFVGRTCAQFVHERIGNVLDNLELI
jgi:hypothetical protein